VNAVARVLALAEKFVRRGWTQGTYAKDLRGHAIITSSLDAACFCSVGAINRACYELDLYKERDQVFKALAKAIPGANPEHDGRMTIVEYNDRPERTQEEVLAVFRQAQVVL
jgi:hypothetical protein